MGRDHALYKSVGLQSFLEILFGQISLSSPPTTIRNRHLYFLKIPSLLPSFSSSIDLSSPSLISPIQTLIIHSSILWPILCAKYYARCWKYSEEGDSSSPCPHPSVFSNLRVLSLHSYSNLTPQGPCLFD